MGFFFKMRFFQNRMSTLKFRFSKKATKIWINLVPTNVKTKMEIAPNFCGLLRKPELYS